MVLHERDEQMGLLTELMGRARAGEGTIAVVHGEGGSGKTSLVFAVAQAVSPPVRLISTGCEPLMSPRPLGPIRDAATQLGLDGAALEGLVDRVLAAMSETATILLIDDLQWADDATLDAVLRLARRFEATSSLLAITYRSDAAASLRPVLGQLARFGAVDVQTPPLSRATVAAIARANQLDPDFLWNLTAGSPFLIEASLASDGAPLPRSAADVVLLATVDLSREGHEVMEKVSCVPRLCAHPDLEAGVVPYTTLERIGVSHAALEEAERSGLLVATSTGVAFKHELGRLAVEATIPNIRRRQIHHELLGAFEAENADPAVLAHHAVGAGDDARIVELCDRAAEEAIGAGAHRQAARLLEEALAAARRRGEDRLGDLARKLAREQYLTSDLAGAIESQRLVLGRELSSGDAMAVSEAHRWLARFCWFDGDRDQAREHSRTAVAVLPPGADAERAAALAEAAHLAALQGDRDAAMGLGEQALALAGDAADVRVSVETDVGMFELGDGLDAGLDRLEDAIVLAAEHSLVDLHARCYTNAAYVLTETRRLDDAERYIARGLEFAERSQLDTWSRFMLGIRARWRLLRGNVAAAIDDAAEAVGGRRNELNQILPGLVRGTVAAREGSADAADILADAQDIAERFGEAHRVVPLVAARAELAWLTGTAPPVDDLARWLDGRGDFLGAWLAGELGMWSARLGGPRHAAGEGTPYQLSLEGDHLGAAARWAELGCPYEQALALVDDGSVDSLLAARDVASELAATATVEMIDFRLRRAGQPIPRGPRPSTLANPASLTARQFEVLELLAAGRTNAEIATELFISVKTAGHHVSAVLTKLAARSRAEAVSIALQRGLIRPPSPETAAI